MYRSLLLDGNFSSKCVTKQYLQNIMNHTAGQNMSARFALHLSYSMYYTMTKHTLGMGVHILFVYFVIHTHILEKTHVLENKFISIFILSFSVTQKLYKFSFKQGSQLLSRCNSNSFMYSSKLIKRKVIPCYSTAILTYA